MGGSPAVASATDEIRAELAAILQSDLFTRTLALTNLLTYLCEKTIAGESNQIKEYTIAVDVFGRRADYDQDSDSIVRVEAARLRKRLKQYYETTGANHRIHISIPVGQYVPSFEERTTEQAEDVESPTADSSPVDTHNVPPSSSRIKWLVTAAIALFCVVFVVAAFIWRMRSHQLPTQKPAAQRVSEPASGLPGGDELRILCGSDRQYIDRSGKTWLADQYFVGGTPVRSNALHIWRTLDQEIYRNSRQGDFGYDIPLKPGVYELRLHFAENYYGPEEQAGGGEGSRIIGVTANGESLIAALDVAADAGESRTADIKTFPGISPAADGVLHLKFWSLYGGRGMVTAIEILPGRNGRIRPVRIATRNSPYYSNDSRWWSPDNFFKGGQQNERASLVSGTEDTELYASERWGNFSYAIPVAPGKYTVALSFVERCGNNSREACLGIAEANGEREFNVLCNGKVLLRNFNIAREAGSGKVVEKRFTGIESTPQGKVVLQFVPQKGYATVTTIEVLPE